MQCYCLNISGLGYIITNVLTQKKHELKDATAMHLVWYGTLTYTYILLTERRFTNCYRNAILLRMLCLLVCFAICCPYLLR